MKMAARLRPKERLLLKRPSSFLQKTQIFLIFFIKFQCSKQIINKTKLISLLHLWYLFALNAEFASIAVINAPKAKHQQNRNEKIDNTRMHQFLRFSHDISGSFTRATYCKQFKNIMIKLSP